MPSLIAVSLPPDAPPVGPFQLDGDTAVIGRDAACQFTVPHPSVGARHARLTRRGSRYFLEPLGADSPLVNSAPVTAPAALRHDDRIGIGGFVFRFVDDRPAGLVAGAQWVPDYLAPEQVNERPDAPPSEATDLHAVGVILFHMLTGELPFPPDLKEMGKLDAIAKRRFASCVRRCAELGLSSRLAPLIDQCLQGGYRQARYLLLDLSGVGQPPPEPPPPAPPADGEPFEVTGLLFEDRLTETVVGVGVESGVAVNLRLVKPTYDTADLLDVFRWVTAADAPPAVVRRYRAGRGDPLPADPGVRFTVDPDAESGGCLAVVEEYAGDRTLMAAIEERAYVGSDAAVVGAAVPLLRALQYAHAGRTIHARLTPYCVFLPPGGGVKVEGLGPPRPAGAALGYGIHATVDANRMSRGGESHTAMSTIGGHRLTSAPRPAAPPERPAPPPVEPAPRPVEPVRPRSWAWLTLVKSPAGGAPGEPIPLDPGDEFVIGRDAEACQIVIPHHAVSRKHARITKIKAQYYIEDLGSRNKTFLNGAEVTARTALRPEDRIKICDFVFRFQDVRSARKPDLPDWMRSEKPEDEKQPEEMTLIEATSGRANVRHTLETQPAEQLRALLDIITDLSRTLELDPLLAQVADTVFGLFRQADRCFVLLLDEAGRTLPKVVKTRRPGVDDHRFSKTIVKRALERLEAYLSEDASGDASLGPAASIAEFKIRSVMCVPLVGADGKAVGAVQLDTQDRAKKFKEDDLKLLTAVASLMSAAVEKARLYEAMLAREKERREMDLARAVQLGFLPQTFPDVQGYEFFAHYSPAQTVGGDYYDFIPMPGGRLAVVLGEVAGKGVPAALLVAKLSSEVRYCLLTEPDPAKAVGLLNEQMMRGGLGDRFVTLVVAVLDPSAHRLTIVNAGHLSPKLLRAARGELSDAISTDAGGLPLGVMPGYEYQAVTLEAEPGDVVAVYTDGVTDAMAPGGELFGQPAVDRFLCPDASAPPDACRPRRLVERLVQAVRRHADGRPQNDDIAVVCFGRVDRIEGVPTGQHHPRPSPLREGRP